MRRATAVLAALLAVFLIACEAGSQPQKGAEPAAPIEAPAPDNDDWLDENWTPGPKAEPPVPAADPGPHNTPTMVEFRVMWDGERRGAVEYTLEAGAKPLRVTPALPRKMSNGKYHGSWVMSVNVRHGQSVGFTYFGEGAAWAMCAIFYMGVSVSYQYGDRGNCAANFTVP